MIFSAFTEISDFQVEGSRKTMRKGEIKDGHGQFPDLKGELGKKEGEGAEFEEGVDTQHTI